MREIKFRAWDKNIEAMVDPAFLQLDGNGLVSIFYENCDSKESEWSNEVQDIELLQYTGLKDKNGEEIYEGDILGMLNPTAKGGCWEVIWHDFRWQLLLRNFPNISNYYVNCGEHLEDDEIIGNIYENPELLRGVK